MKVYAWRLEYERGRRNATKTAVRSKLGFFGHVMRSDGLEKGMMLACGEGRREEDDQGEDGWMRDMKKLE